MTRRGFSLLSFLFLFFKQFRELGGTASQRQRWSDFFDNGYFPNALLSELFFTGDGVFVLLLEEASYQHRLGCRPNKMSDEILFEVLRLEKSVHLFAE